MCVRACVHACVCVHARACGHFIPTKIQETVGLFGFDTRWKRRLFSSGSLAMKVLVAIGSEADSGAKDAPVATTRTNKSWVETTLK